MHELMLANEVCEVVREYLEPHHRLASVLVEYGPLSGVVPESLDFCFDLVAESYEMAGAKLRMKLLPALASCLECGSNFQISSISDQCPTCRGRPTNITGGRGFRIREIEVEDV